MTQRPAQQRARARHQLELLFARVREPRASITPGDLYRRMSTEFRNRRAANHGSCVMPMVVCRRETPLSLNWGLEQLTASCAQCEALSLDIAWRHAERFEVRLLGTRVHEDDTPLAQAA
jgi:hypothetical protein